MLRVDEVKRPLIIGEKFLVPCIVKTTYEEDNSQWVTYITPVWNHPHNDKENGQEEVHYHIDSRFYSETSTFLSKKYKLDGEFRPQLGENYVIDYFILPVLNDTETRPTHTHLIRKSELKHNCIHKGKCPHRGMDLSQVKPKDGVIKCPLHGLVFHEKTGKLLTRKYDKNQLSRTMKNGNKDQG